MDTMQFNVIQTGLVLETIFFGHLVVPLNNFAPVSNCPWVQGKSNSPLPRCVCGGGGGGGNSYSMILPQFLVSLILMNMQLR